MTSKTTDESVVSAEAIEQLAYDILKQSGLSSEEASLLADALITADARGMNSHGVMRLPIYFDRIRSGGALPGTKGTILRETSSTVLLDGENGIGHIIASRAMDEALRKAKESGVGVVGVTRSNHFGEAAFYTRKAIREDMIGLVTTNGSPNTPVWGGLTKMTGPSAFSVGIPAGDELPILLDIAMGVVSKGKVLYAAEKGEKIPLGWGVDSQGQPTDDPQEVLDGGWTSFIGAYKGWGLMLVYEVLSGVLTGGRIANEIGNLYGDPAQPQGLGHFIMAIDIEAFTPIDRFKQRIDQHIRLMKQSELAPGVEEILMPGEREFRLEQDRRAHGIPVSNEVLAHMRELAEEVGVKFTLGQ